MSLSYFAGDADCFPVDLADLLFQVVLAQNNAGGAEGVGFDDVSTYGQIAVVNLLDHVWPAEDQNFAAALFPPIVVSRGLEFLDRSPHGAVVDDDTLAN